MAEQYFKNTFTVQLRVVESELQGKICTVLNDRTFWEHCSEKVDALVREELNKKIVVVN